MEAYIYTYVNRETKKTYIGARCAYTGSCYDDFNIKYFSSSNDKEFRKDMSDGKLEGQIILVMNDENANKKIFEVEAKMIKAYWDKYGKENSYNHYASGKWSNAGRHLSDEAKLKISKANKGKQTGEKNPMYGKHWSEEWKQQQSKRLKGKNTWSKGVTSWNKGIPCREESKQKNRLAHIGLFAGEKNPMYGKQHSAEIRKKMSDAIKLNSNTKWITQDGEIKMMNSGNVKRWHPDWVLCVQETENTY